MIAPEDRCDLCHKLAEVDDSDQGLCPHCRAELWLHTRCAESGGPCPRRDGLWTDKLPALSADLSPAGDAVGRRLLEDS